MRRTAGRAERRPRTTDDVELGVASILIGALIVLTTFIVPIVKL